MKYKLNIPLQIHLGVPEQERAGIQEVCVIVEFEADTKKAQKSDSIQDCPVDYQQIYDLVQDFETQEFCLLESLHHAIYKALKERFPMVKDWEVTLFKQPWERGYVEVTDTSRA